MGLASSERFKERNAGVMKKNVGMIERVLRVALGGTLAIWFLVQLFSGGAGLIYVLLQIALVLLGVDFVVTGVLGYCPLYNRLGWSTARLDNRT